MENPGAIPLGDFPLATAGTFTGGPVKDLAGMLALTLYAKLQLGNAGNKVQAYFQTSFDQGQTFCDIACAAFTNAGGEKIVNLSALDKLTDWTVPTDGALPDNTVLDGPLGDILQVKVKIDGVYGNSLLSCWAVAK